MLQLGSTVLHITNTAPGCIAAATPPLPNSRSSVCAAFTTTDTTTRQAAASAAALGAGGAAVAREVLGGAGAHVEHLHGQAGAPQRPRHAAPHGAQADQAHGVLRRVQAVSFACWCGQCRPQLPRDNRGMRSRDDPPAAASDDSFASLFDFLPIGAYRAQPDGRLLRANAALVRLNDCASEDELHARARSIDSDWYVDSTRRDQFRALLFRDGQVRAFVSQVRLLVSRRLIWVSETAHLVHDAQGRLLYYEGTVEEVTERIEAAAALQRSEQQLREIAARVPGVVYRLRVGHDGTRRFTFVSEGVQALYGVRPEDVLANGELLRSFDHPADHLRVSLETEASRRSGRPVQTEFRIVLTDGTQKWVQLAASSVASDAQGHIRVGVMMDISARKQAELALRGSEERWTLALDSLGDGVWDWDIARGREVVSARLLEMYGLRREAHGDRPEALDALTHPDDRAQMQADREAHFSGRTASYMNEHRMRCSDGRWKWILSRGMVIERDAAGQPLRMIGTHTDISARKEAEALRQERDRSAAAQKAQSAFLSRVSHELRTPMNAIIGFAQLLEMDQAGNERQRAWVQTILDSGRHLLALVNDLLDLSSARDRPAAVHAHRRRPGAAAARGLGHARRRGACCRAALRRRAAGRALVGAGRPDAAEAGGEQPAVQRHQVQPPRRPGAGGRCALRRRRHAQHQRHRAGHGRGAAGTAVHALRARWRAALAGGRHRPRAGAGQATGGGDGRRHHRAQQAGSGLGVQRDAEDRRGRCRVARAGRAARAARATRATQRARPQRCSNLNTATLARRLGQRRTTRPACRPKLSVICRPLLRASTSKSA